ncbi:glycosyltransferase family 1 protein [Methyloparacoccus murrellii]
MSPPLRILIDANPMVLRTGATHLPGIGRSSLELAKALDELNDPGVSIRLLTQTFRGRLPARFVHLPVINVPWPIGPRYDWLKRLIPLLEARSPHDLLHVPGNFAEVFSPAKTVATIHDVMFFSYPQEFLGHAYSRRHVPAFAQACAGIATPSEHAKGEIVHYLQVPPDKVTVIPWGVDRTLFHAQDKPGARERVAKTTGSQRPYFLSVSCDIGRKNTISVLRAYQAAWQGGCEHDLLVVWGDPPAAYRQEFAGALDAGRLRFLRHVPDEQLGDLYAGATATFFPSRYEGYGLPVLESLACGTPVVTCRNSSLPEVGRDAALYVDPDGVDDLCDLMRLFDTGASPGAAHEMPACLAQADRFTWRNAAAAYVAFYRRHAGE